MRIGFRLLCTCFSKRKQLALNSEIGISLMLHLVNETYQSRAYDQNQDQLSHFSTHAAESYRRYRRTAT